MRVLSALSTASAAVKALKIAGDLVSGKRDKDYGDPKASFESIAQAWSWYLKTEVKPEDVAQMMTLLKISRHKTGAVNLDNFVDASGYQGLAAALLKLVK